VETSEPEDSRSLFEKARCQKDSAAAAAIAANVLYSGQMIGSRRKRLINKLVLADRWVGYRSRSLLLASLSRRETVVKTDSVQNSHILSNLTRSSSPATEFTVC
jgi:hypothetical protein